MNRGTLLWFGSVALLLLFAAWWFTVITTSAMPLPGLAPWVAIAVLVMISLALFWAGWRKGISGLFVLASTLLGFGVIGFVQWTSAALPGRVLWLLLPAFSGAGILSENHLGIGWRFSNQQGFWMILASLLFFLAALLWFIHPGNAGIASRSFESVSGLNASDLRLWTNFDFLTNLLYGGYS
jgi:hypothetical protein